MPFCLRCDTQNPGKASATVAWTPPSDTGGSPITAYTVTASPGGASVTVDGSSTTATVTRLTKRTSYTFTVQPTNAAGSGAPSQPSNQIR
ncbi:MAG: fibronectin type III domain-containing protein [Acidimicrobiales bacterium]